MIVVLALVMLVAALVILQGSFFPFLTPGIVQPDLMLVFVLAYSFVAGEKRASAVGIGIGLTQDLVFGSPPGLFAITKYVSSVLMGISSKYFNQEVIFIPMALCLPLTVIHELMVVFFRGLILSSSLSIGSLLLYVILPRALVNMIALTVIFPLVAHLVPKGKLFFNRGTGK